MYIDKWWDDIVGGTDDSLLLIDYFGNHATKNNLRQFDLRTVLNEIHLLGGLESNTVEDSDVYFVIDGGFESHFDMGLDVVIDISALVLESMHNQEINFESLNQTSKYTEAFSINADKEAVALLMRGLSHFVENPKTYLLYEFSGEYSEELLATCTEIRDELKA